MRRALVNGRVITPYRDIPRGGVLMEGGHIASVFAGDFAGEADAVDDARGCYISPGFIDLHTHGGHGHDYMDGTPEAVIGAARAHLRHGTTSLLPTTMTAPEAELFRLFDAYRAAKARMHGGPHLLGLHLEGPFFAPAFSGAQDARYLLAPDAENAQRILAHADIIARVSLAPELPGAMAFARALRRRAILASIGHSGATHETVLQACENGFSLVTHFYSGNSSLQRVEGRRVLGIVETAYLADDLAVEIICDGLHLPPELLRLILRGKPRDRVCLTTDSMRGTDMPEGSVVKLGSLQNGQDAIVEGGVAWMAHRQSFAGSVCTMDRCVRTAVKLAGATVQDAVRMASLNPARALGCGHKGVLAPDMDADVCVFDDEIQMQAVYVSGTLAWKRRTEDEAGL